MRLIVAAVGRLKQGPERDLSGRYRQRIAKAGPSIGFSGIELIEVAESRAREVVRRKIEESIALAQLLPLGAARILLDAGGENLGSAAFATRLQRWRDNGRPAAFFLVGGPDGVADNLRDDVDLSLSFGAATWPHQLARIMLLEQLYRAVTILAGHPYHRAE